MVAPAYPPSEQGILLWPIHWCVACRSPRRDRTAGLGAPLGLRRLVLAKLHSCDSLIEEKLQRWSPRFS